MNSTDTDGIDGRWTERREFECANSATVEAIVTSAADVTNGAVGVLR